jgi:hypothetical protein
MTSAWVLAGAFAVTLFAGDGGAIEGRVVDLNSTPLRADVRVVLEDGTIVRRLKVDGEFAIGDLLPGVYNLHFSRTRFRARWVRGLKVPDGSAVRAGDVILLPAPRDPDSGVSLRAKMSVKRGCGLDLDPRPPMDCDSPEGDIVFRVDNDRLSLVALHGAELGQAEGATKCQAATYSKDPIPIDEAGPGDYYCVRTSAGNFTTLILEEEAARSTDVWISYSTVKK